MWRGQLIWLPSVAVVFLRLSMSAPMGNFTETTDLTKIRLNTSESQSVYRTAPSPRRSVAAGEGNIGFYKADVEGSGIPSGLKANLQQRPPAEDLKPHRGRTRHRGSGRSGRLNSGFFEEDAETIDEKELRGKGRGRNAKRPPAQEPRPGYKPFGASSAERDAEIIQTRRPESKRLVIEPVRGQSGYRPFGATEVEHKPRSSYKAQDDESGVDFDEPSTVSHGSYKSSSSSVDSDGLGSEGNDEYPGETVESAGYKVQDDEADEEPVAIHVPDIPAKDDLGDKLEEVKAKLDEPKPIADDVEHESEGSASTDVHSEDFVSAPHHHHHGAKDHHFVKEGARKHNSEHHSASGEKGKKGYKKSEAHESGEQGKHGKESHKALSGAKKGHKKTHLDQDAKYAEKHDAEKGSKGSEFSDKGKHKKGHSTKGFRTVHRKDEFKKDETFYDESDISGHHSKEGKAEQNHAKKHGEKVEKKHSDGAYDEGKVAKEGEKAQGSHLEHKKGYKGAEKNQEQHRHVAKNSKEGGSKAAHEHARAGAASDHYDR